VLFPSVEAIAISSPAPPPPPPHLTPTFHDRVVVSKPCRQTQKEQKRHRASMSQRPVCHAERARSGYVPAQCNAPHYAGTKSNARIATSVTEQLPTARIVSAKERNANTNMGTTSASKCAPQSLFAVTSKMHCGKCEVSNCSAANRYSIPGCPYELQRSCSLLGLISFVTLFRIRG
jgi:hypothetical protein